MLWPEKKLHIRPYKIKNCLLHLMYFYILALTYPIFNRKRAQFFVSMKMYNCMFIIYFVEKYQYPGLTAFIPEQIEGTSHLHVSIS